MNRKYQAALQYLIKNKSISGTMETREELQHLITDLGILCELDWENMDKPTQEFTHHYINSMSALMMIWESMDIEMGVNSTIH